MDFITLTLLVGFIVTLIWLFWFAYRMNGIHEQLRLLNDKAFNQLEFLDYIADELAQDGRKKTKGRLPTE